MARLRVRAQQAAQMGLCAEEVDKKLWGGAAADGWRVHDCGRNDGHYRYTAPDGRRYHSKAEALATRAEVQERKKASTRRGGGEP